MKRKAAELHEEVEGDDGQRRAEGGHPEEPQVDQRIGQRSLPAHEDDAEGQPGQDGQHGRPAQAVLGDLLEPVDHRQHGGQRQGRR